MTKRYTASDFANARFAEHADGQIAMRSADPDVDEAWEVWTNTGYLLSRSDSHMAFAGWVPAPTKPQVTESEYERVLAGVNEDYATGYIDAVNTFGIEVIPDPEPTNTERLGKLIRGWHDEGKPWTLDAYLDKHGVTAPKENK